ncbi:MAG: hypothetical protein ACOCWL_02475 [Thermoguttaceae bacterium]
MIPWPLIGQVNDMWYALPLILAVSLVYAATRHEETVPILVHAGRLALWIVGFMVAIFALLYLISWGL